MLENYPPEFADPQQDTERPLTAQSLFLWAGVTVTGFLLSQFAFSRGVRNKILERDGRKCVICGSTEHLEAAHILHDKTRKDYNDPKNGRTLCSQCHYHDHINRHGSNGLTKKQNEWAIEQLSNRIGY